MVAMMSTMWTHERQETWRRRTPTLRNVSKRPRTHPAASLYQVSSAVGLKKIASFSNRQLTSQEDGGPTLGAVDTSTLTANVKRAAAMGSAAVTATSQATTCTMWTTCNFQNIYIWILHLQNVGPLYTYDLHIWNVLKLHPSLYVPVLDACT